MFLNEYGYENGTDYQMILKKEKKKMREKISRRKCNKAMMALAVLVITASILMSSKISNANNYKDTEYVFYFTAGKEKGYVDSVGREKMDYSKTYIMCNYAYEPYVEGDLKFTAQAHGSNSSGSGFATCTYNGHTTPSYVIHKDTSKYMTNYIKETNKKYANIYVKKNGPAATFRGKWSPDNYNKY